MSCHIPFLSPNHFGPCLNFFTLSPFLSLFFLTDANTNTHTNKDTHTHNIVKIDSRTRSFCLCQYVQNGLSFLGEETQPKLCLKGRQANSGISSLGTNKHQLLHRIQSVEPSLIYNNKHILVNTCAHVQKYKINPYTRHGQSAARGGPHAALQLICLVLGPFLLL